MCFKAGNTRGARYKLTEYPLLFFSQKKEITVTNKITINKNTK